MDSAQDYLEVEVPSYFRCPISMELIRDPVTVSTGVTYDRESIEHWIFSCKKKTCPATMQLLENFDLIPNHTLRRLIKGWCVANSSKGVEQIPTPRPPIDSDQVSMLLESALRSPSLEGINALKKLRSIARESEGNRRSIAASGSSQVLASLMNSYCCEENDNEKFRACEETLGILYLLPMTQETAKYLSKAACIRSMSSVLHKGTAETRLHAVFLLQKVSTWISDWEFIGREKIDIFQGLLEIITGEVCQQAIIAALAVFIAICKKSRKNRLWAIEAGAVFSLIELLPDAEKPKCEKILDLLDMLVDYAEGRAAMADHAMGIAVVSKKIIRVSEIATQKAVRILWSLSIYSSNASILREMLQCGAVSKLCMLQQLSCTDKTKQKAKEVLKLHVNTFRVSPCLPYLTRTYYPQY
jgi:hypothetical protein